MRNGCQLLLILLSFLASSCGDPALHEAEACLHRFHQSLVDGDRNGLRDTVTHASKPYVAHLPEKKPAGDRQPLRVVDASYVEGRVRLRVRDDNDDAQVSEGTYVVVREFGDWRVDLIETAGANSREVPNEGAARRLVPTQVTPAQIEAARRKLGR